ncbi:MAG: NAD-dependent epimerase/dehydratase family protein [Methylotenera sp.]
MKIAISGGTGFIGKKLVQHHLTMGDEVRYLTRTDNQPIIGASAIIGDLNSTDNQLMPLFSNSDVFYHCAGELKSEALMHSTHVQGTINLLNVIEKIHSLNKKNFHWVQLSSCGAYGQAHPQPSIPRYVDENNQDSPSGEYENTKTEADKLIISFAKQHDWFKYTIIRPTNVFGVGMRSTAIKRIAQMVKKRLFFYVGNRNSIANFVHVDDVVKAMVLSTNQSKAYNQTFIVSNDCKFSDMVDTIASALQLQKPNWVVNEFLLRNLVNIVGKWIKLPISTTQIDVMTRQTYYSNKKIRNTLDWSPSTSVLVQLKHYIDAIFNDKNG